MSQLTGEQARLLAEIEDTRADLAETVDALTAKLDVKAQAAQKVRQARLAVLDAVLRTQPYQKQVLLGMVAAAAVLIGVRQVRSSR